MIVTVIADTYFGYCKEEVKAQISYSANLFGNAEEEHSGGALVFASYDLGQEFTETSAGDSYSLAEVLGRDPDRFAAQPPGHALDLQQPHIVLVPAHARYSLRAMTVSWTDAGGRRQSIPAASRPGVPGPERLQREDRPATQRSDGLEPDRHRAHGYVVPQAGDRLRWRQVGDLQGHQRRFRLRVRVRRRLRGRHGLGRRDPRAGLLQALPRPRRRTTRTTGPSCRRNARSGRSSNCSPRPARPTTATTTPGWIGSRRTSKELVYVVKHGYRPEWGADWRSHFSVVSVDSRQGNRLRLDERLITINMLRVGYNDDGSWRLFSLRHDFSPAAKVQTEGDITASTVVPGDQRGWMRRGRTSSWELREPAVPASRRRHPSWLRQAG